MYLDFTGELALIKQEYIYNSGTGMDRKCRSLNE